MLNVMISRLNALEIRPTSVFLLANDEIAEITVAEYTLFVPKSYNQSITIVKNFDDKQIIVATSTNPSIIARTMNELTTKVKHNGQATSKSKVHGSRFANFHRLFGVKTNRNG